MFPASIQTCTTLHLKCTNTKGHDFVTMRPTFKRERSNLISNIEQAISESGQERAISVQNLHELDAKTITMMKKSHNKTSSGTQRSYSCNGCGEED